jgi:hypothetical protein
MFRLQARRFATANGEDEGSGADEGEAGDDAVGDAREAPADG